MFSGALRLADRIKPLDADLRIDMPWKVGEYFRLRAQAPRQVLLRYFALRSIQTAAEWKAMRRSGADADAEKAKGALWAPYLLSRDLLHMDEHGDVDWESAASVLSSGSTSEIARWVVGEPVVMKRTAAQRRSRLQATLEANPEPWGQELPEGADLNDSSLARAARALVVLLWGKDKIPVAAFRRMGMLFYAYTLWVATASPRRHDAGARLESLGEAQAFRFEMQVFGADPADPAFAAELAKAVSLLSQSSQNDWEAVTTWILGRNVSRATVLAARKKALAAGEMLFMP